jgi:DNA-binding response OmpR family regulator
VADDIADNVSLLARYLQNEGYSFITAADGVETLNKTFSEMPDLILLDVNMPGKDGLEVLREIRSDPTLQHIPVIMLTAARVDPADMRAGLNLGADDYVTKPFDRRELLARIRTKLRAKEVEEAVRRRYNELSVLPEIGRDLSARLDVNELADVILRRAVETLGAMSARLVVFNPQTPVDKEFHLQAPGYSPAMSEFPFLNQLMDQVRQSREVMVINDLRRDPRWGVVSGYPMNSVIILPLVGRLDLVGLLVLIHEQAGYFVSGHQLLLQAIASQATIALEGAALNARLTRA